MTKDDASLPGFIRRLLPSFSGQPLGPLLTMSLRSLARRRPQAFERLGEHRKARFLIDPTDLPFAFSVIPDGPASIVQATGKSASSDVIIRGPILMLLGILDGTLDGDALFFHRSISVSGRTEAVVALRNAIEDAELRPSDMLGIGGQLAQIADTGILGALAFARRVVAGARVEQEHIHER